MKILVSGGRTGGHLIPGIAVYEELKKRNLDVHYVMSVFDLNFPITSKIAENDRILLDIKNISRKLSLKTPYFIYRIFKSFLDVFHKIKEYNPDKIVITGGYISNPVALSALLLKKPLYIIEQNSVAGVTNRIYAPFARRIYTAFPDTRKIPQRKSELTGNPSIFLEKIDKNQAKKHFGLENFDRIIGISGGSQGAKKINEAVLKILPELKKNNIGIIWSMGSVDYKRISESGTLEKLNKEFPNVKAFQFIERMDFLFSAIDMIISRAGATSISEFINFSIPALLIPIHKSPDNHQFLNANYLAENNAGVIIEEIDLSDETLKNGITKMLAGIKNYREAADSLKKELYAEKPARKIADSILS